MCSVGLSFLARALQVCVLGARQRFRAIAGLPLESERGPTMLWAVRALSLPPPSAVRLGGPGLGLAVVESCLSGFGVC